jgi:hypothetical protein
MLGTRLPPPSWSFDGAGDAVSGPSRGGVDCIASIKSRRRMPSAVQREASRTMPRLRSAITGHDLALHTLESTPDLEDHGALSVREPHEDIVERGPTSWLRPGGEDVEVGGASGGQ